MGDQVHVRVAVRIRPLLPKEILHSHQVCVRVIPGPDSTGQVMLGSDRDFSFDHAFGPAVSQDAFYESCVQPLVRSLVEGYNATVFAYGQTGSGKTYTLHDEEGMGIVGRVAYDVFTGLKGEQATVTMSYMELYREELRDLLELHTDHKELHIREDDRGNTVVVGLKEMLVSSVEELLSILDTGNALRHTGTTRMNERSSRSHTILTLQVTKHCHGSISTSNTVCLSKLHLVDLAGSERASKTGNTGIRLKESAHINTDLLALGNVIRALTDPGRNRRESHVPFRDAKITRLLRDSLGGSAHTLMVACVSPSHHSVAETLSVLQFASRARHVRNRPGKTCAITWDPGVARRGELEQEVQTLREALKDKGRELDAVRGKEEVHSQQASQMDRELDPEGAQAQHVTIVQLRRELNKCQEALAIDEQVFVQKEDELRQVQKEMQKLLQESKIHLQAFEQEKERTRIQTEQMVDQQILIDRLHDNLMTSKVTSLEEGVSGKLARRPHSVPLLRHSCGHGPVRNIHTSPPAYSLERVMAAFKMRGQLLLAEVEEKDEVYCPFITQQEKLNHSDQGQEEVNEEGGMGFRRSLNRTWTCRQNPSQKQNNTLLEQRSQNRMNLPQQPQSATEEISAENCSPREASIIQRRIRELSINMRMKEELIKELDKTGEEAEAAERRGRQAGGGALARLSLQSQQARAELHRSLQHMKLQRLQLQHSLRQQSEVRDTTGLLLDDQSTDLAVEDLTVCQSSLTEDSEEKEQQSVWLEEEEELALQRRAELQELEEELRTREEVLQRRDDCLQQRHKLEIKRLRSSQALNRDQSLLSDELHSLEKQLEGSSTARQAVGVTAGELEKERDALIQRRDALDLQLRDGRLLTAQEEHSLLQLEEAVEALDTALEFKNRSIVNRQKQLSITCQSHSTEPAQLCDVIMKLRELSLPEASELLVQYFNKVVHLREEDRHLRLHCEELQLQAWEQDKVLREMEAALQRVALETDRRLTQQHREHQGTIQLLLQQFTGGSAEKDETLQARVQQLEKELFFYKSSSRQLKKKVRELLNDPQLSLPLPATQPSLQQTRPESSHTDTHNMQVNTRTSSQQTPVERRKTHKLQAKMSQALVDTGQTAHTQRHKHRTSCPSSSSELQTHRKSKVLTYASVHAHTQPEERNGGGHSGDALKMMPVCLPRRELRQISPADLQVGVNATGGRHSAAKTTIDSIPEDSIEMDC